MKSGTAILPSIRGKEGEEIRMELTIAERFVLLNMLPQQGDITTVKIVRQLREALSFSEQEHVDYEIHTEPDGNGRAIFRWNPSKSGAVKDVEIVGVGRKLVVEALQRMEQEKSLTESHVTLWDKFMST